MAQGRARKPNLMSVNMETAMYNLIKAYVKDKDITFSEFVRRWLQQFPYRTDVIPVVLDIPQNLVKNKEALETFLKKKNEAIIRLLCDN